MLHVAKTFLFVCLFALCVSCSTLELHYDYDPSFDFSRLKTYQWLPASQSKDISQLNLQRIQQAVNEQLQGKGFQQAEKNPDFLVGLIASKQDKVQIIDWGYNFGPYGSLWNDNIDTYAYEEGSIILDFINPYSKNLFWRGAAKEAIDPDLTPEERIKAVNEVVQGILKGFPPLPAAAQGK
jgi:hypothetical protein